jgi:hypothetical protein
VRENSKPRSVELTVAATCLLLARSRENLGGQSCVGLAASAVEYADHSGHGGVLALATGFKADALRAVGRLKEAKVEALRAQRHAYLQASPLIRGEVTAMRSLVLADDPEEEAGLAVVILSLSSFWFRLAEDGRLPHTVARLRVAEALVARGERRLAVPLILDSLRRLDHFERPSLAVGALGLLGEALEGQVAEELRGIVDRSSARREILTTSLATY